MENASKAMSHSQDNIPRSASTAEPLSGQDPSYAGNNLVIIAKELTFYSALSGKFEYWQL